MHKHTQQQLEQFQHGLTAAFEQGSKLVEPMLRTNEVMIDGLGQLLKDQFEFGQSCMAIGRRQMTAFMRAPGPAALRASRDAAGDYYAAARQYGEAVRSNAVQTHKRLIAIGHEAAHAATGTRRQRPATAHTQAPVATRMGPAAEKTATATSKAGHASASKTAAKTAATGRKSTQQAKSKTATKATGKNARKTTRKSATKTAASKTAKRKTPARTAASARISAADKVTAPAAKSKAADTPANAPAKNAKVANTSAKATTQAPAKHSTDS